jgi:hypothetical protein
MSHSEATVHFHQACPVCGRQLRVRLSLLGQRVYCQHCGGGFVATDPDLARQPADHRDARVERLLEAAARVVGDADR